MNTYSDFENWLDGHLKNLPNDIIAVNFCLYEESSDIDDPDLEEEIEQALEESEHPSEELLNSYNGLGFSYGIQLAGFDKFDESDKDWACSWTFTTGEDICHIPRVYEIMEWEQGLSFITSLVKKYLIEGAYANKLKNFVAIGIGFVDGEIELIHHYLSSGNIQLQ